MKKVMLKALGAHSVMILETASLRRKIPTKPADSANRQKCADDYTDEEFYTNFNFTKAEFRRLLSCWDLTTSSGRPKIVNIRVQSKSKQGHVWMSAELAALLFLKRMAFPCRL
jgi:hypothetical protein